VKLEPHTTHSRRSRLYPVQGILRTDRGGGYHCCATGPLAPNSRTPGSRCHMDVPTAKPRVRTAIAKKPTTKSHRPEADFSLGFEGSRFMDQNLDANTGKTVLPRNPVMRSTRQRHQEKSRAEMVGAPTGSSVRESELRCIVEANEAADRSEFGATPTTQSGLHQSARAGYPLSRGDGRTGPEIQTELR